MRPSAHGLPRLNDLLTPNTVNQTLSGTITMDEWFAIQNYKNKDLEREIVRGMISRKFMNGAFCVKPQHVVIV